jgi:hypothetical protein
LELKECDFFLILLNKRAQDLRLLTVYTLA